MTELAEVDVDRSGDECVVRVTGEIDMSNSQEISGVIESGVGSDVRRVVVDLSETRYLDSAGVRLLLVLAGRLQSRRQELRLRIPAASPIRSTVTVAGLEGAIPVDLA